MDGLSAYHFQGVHMNHIPIVEDLVTLNIVQYDIAIVDGNKIEKLVRRSVKNTKHWETTEKQQPHMLLGNFIAVLQSFRFLYYDTLFNRTFNLERNLTKCSE